METITPSSSERTRGPHVLRLVAEAVVATGVVLMTLGILEIGGLFNVAVGFFTILAGCLLLFLRGDADELSWEEELSRLRDER